MIKITDINEFDINEITEENGFKYATIPFVQSLSPEIFDKIVEKYIKIASEGENGYMSLAHLTASLVAKEVVDENTEKDLIIFLQKELYNKKIDCSKENLIKELTFSLQELIRKYPPVSNLLNYYVAIEISLKNDKLIITKEIEDKLKEIISQFSLDYHTTKDFREEIQKFLDFYSD